MKEHCGIFIDFGLVLEHDAGQFHNIYIRPYTPLEMCAVGGLVRLGRMFGGVTTVPVCLL